MKDAERRFDVVVESIKDYAIFLLDPDGTIRTWNSGAELIKGYRPDEAIGRHVSMFYTDEDRARGQPESLLAAARAKGQVEDAGWRLRKGGTRFWGDVVITAMRDDRGELVGFVKVTRDLTERKQADERLQSSEQSLSATLYSIGDAVLATDEQGRVTRINPVAARLTGWPEHEAVGRPLVEVFRIIHEETRAVAANPVDRVLKEGIVVGLANHTTLIARDGTERPIADSGAPIVGPDGRIRGAVLVFRDVTEERVAEEALRQSEQKLRLMIASVSDHALFMLDPEGRVVSWNPGAERIKGYRAEEIIGRHFSLFFSEEDRAAGKPQRELDAARRDGRFAEESWRVRKDGTRFWASVVLDPIRDSSGGLVGFVKVTRDLTDRLQAEQERVRLAQTQEAVRLRDEFLSIASHELKTPLTALMLQLEAIAGRVPEGQEKLAQRLDRAVKLGDRLTSLIEALLDVSRIATGELRLQPEPLDLAEAVQEVIERFRDAAAGAGSELRCEVAGPLPGTWDRLRVEQVLMNLVSNSIKYAPGKPIRVSAARDGDHVVMQVRDHGPGIPEEEVARVFERFERAVSPRHYGGLGLGLYVARQIVEAHGGTIGAGNAPGGGALLTVRLPLVPPPAAVAPSA